jgi:hypothetical protein
MRKPGLRARGRWHDRCTAARRETNGGVRMGDITFILITVAFFALAAAYTRGCERL